MKKIKTLSLRKVVYSILISSSIIYIAYFIDSSYYHNLTKIKFSSDEPIYLNKFEIIKNSVEPDNAFNATITIKKHEVYLSVDAFDDVLLNETNSIVLKRNGLHPTQSSALFAMNYLTHFFLDSYNSHTLNKAKLKLIEDTYLFVYKEINNPFSLNPMAINDHVVSERIQFLSLFISYTRQYHPKKLDLLKALTKDFNLCYRLIIHRDFFNWTTNHGIMQLRSLGQLLNVVKDRKKEKEILNEFDERLNDIIPYFIGNDGAIYESATGYWYYIYSQFQKISQLSKVQKLPSIKKLKERLIKTKRFLNCVASNDYYIEGIGDSYSYYLLQSDRLNIYRNRYFYFSNSLCGANWTVNNLKVNILFSSLYTPPNIHKLPDDLTLMIYANKPFFTNTGIYSYDKSKERRLFEIEESVHNTPSIVNGQSKNNFSSIVKLVSFDSINSIVTFLGKKNYYNKQSLSREIKIDPTISSITIMDKASRRNKIKTTFNVHPETSVQKISNRKYILTNQDSIKLTVITNNDITIKKSVISSSPQNIDTIKQLVIYGNQIITEMRLKNSNKSFLKFSLEKTNLKNRRLYWSKYLSKKYNFKLQSSGFSSVLIKRIVLVGLLFLLSTFLLEFSLWHFNKRP